MNMLAIKTKVEESSRLEIGEAGIVTFFLLRLKSLGATAI